MKFLIALIALLTPIQIASANQVALESKVFVERTQVQSDGTVETILSPPERVVPGDVLVFVLNYENKGDEPVNDFSVTNPLPDAVAFRKSDDAGTVYSVDGGKNWGVLAELSVLDVDGESRPAMASDATHIRWLVAEPIPIGGTGQLTFTGVIK